MGVFGASAMRCGVVTANSLSLPACNSGSAAVIWSNMKVTWPDETSIIAGGVPLYGMWLRGTLIRSANNSPARWVDVPAPDEAKVRFFSSFLSSATSSATVFTPRLGSTSSTFGRKATSATGSKSFTGS